MDLDEYLSQPGSPKTVELARAAGLNPDQIRQWRRGHDERVPGTKSSVAIERATGGAVRRWDLRPDDWWEHWPELINADGAPPVPSERDAAVLAKRRQMGLGQPGAPEVPAREASDA